MAATVPMLGEDETVPMSELEKDPAKEQYASVIANQAKEIFRKGHPLRRRYDTYFCTIVLGGNTRAVQNAVEYMENNGMKDVLDWLLKRTDKKPSKYKTLLNSCSVTAKRCAIFFLLMVFNIITTPIFYVIHKMTYAMFNQQEKRISKNIRLPLAYAVFSQKEDMWTYFLSLGAGVMDYDSEGNNIFHYIADMSAESPDRAITMFKMVIEFINDMDSVKTLVLDKTNTAGLSALEYVVKYGSPSLIKEVLHYPNLLRHTVLTVKDDTLSFNEKKVPSEEKATVSDTSIDHVDVSRYECGKVVHQSSILNLLSGRSLTMMSRDDLKIFKRTALVGKWMSMKVKQMVVGVVSLHSFDVVLTLLLLLASFLLHSS